MIEKSSFGVITVLLLLKYLKIITGQDVLIKNEIARYRYWVDTLINTVSRQKHTNGITIWESHIHLVMKTGLAQHYNPYHKPATSFTILMQLLFLYIICGQHIHDLCIERKSLN
jgi:hypothetical protein